MKWTLVSWFGNTPLARAVMFIPIVAQFAIYSERYLPERWGLNNTLWLYWSLNLLAAGQILYSLAAPRAIKRFGSDEEKFIESALNTWSTLRFQLQATRYVQSHFEFWKGGPLELPVQTNSDLEQRFQRLETDYVAERNNLSDRKRTIIASLRTVTRDAPLSVPFAGGTAKDWLAFFEDLQGKPLSPTQEDSVRTLNFFSQHDANDNQWKLDILNWLYLSANRSRSALCAIVASLYLAGSIYFLWNTARNLWSIAMISTHQGFLPQN
nr:hypothetical protein [uncultured Hyphomonas sp.]